MRAKTTKKTARVHTKLHVDDEQGHLLHHLAHELEADGIALIVYSGSNLKCSFRFGCHVDDPVAQQAIAQVFRQACATLSTSLRERYVERKHAAGDAGVMLVTEADDAIDGDVPKPDPEKVH